MGKRNKKQDEGEEIARELLRLIPTLPRVLQRVFRRVEHFDYKQPTTVVGKSGRADISWSRKTFWREGGHFVAL